jgi:hypothetical protein
MSRVRAACSLPPTLTPAHPTHLAACLAHSTRCTLRLHHDHARTLFPDSAAFISTFVKSLCRSTYVVAYRGPIRFVVFLAFVFNLTFRSATSCGRHIDRGIRNPRFEIYGRIFPGQSGSIHNIGSHCGKHSLPVSTLLTICQIPH